MATAARTTEPPQNQVLPRWTKEDYITWINRNLPDSVGPVSDMTRSLRSGVALVRLVEQLSGEVVDKRIPNSTYTLQMLENLLTAFKFMERVGVSTEGYTVKDIFNGNEDKIRMMLDAIRTRFPGNSSNSNTHYDSDDDIEGALRDPNAATIKPVSTSTLARGRIPTAIRTTEPPQNRVLPHLTKKDIFNGNEDKIRAMIDAIQAWFPEDMNRNTSDYMYRDTATPMLADEDSPTLPPSGSHTPLPYHDLYDLHHEDVSRGEGYV
ncbi:MAG: calponin homology domain-containing protein [Benniella sp.]|nr:MAG: calponin homology domain-containing protein [Benniella sp.]